MIIDIIPKNMNNFIFKLNLEKSLVIDALKMAERILKIGKIRNKSR